MTKSLDILIEDLRPTQVVGDVKVAISAVVNDSRKVCPGALFVAVRGVAVDSHRFMDQVASAGASAIVCEA